ncbi:MAG: hypothetical protein NPINA01_05680 [Nitrospinaceae bacterium]|nr:MAG: hypothetical protein NPINA01_05680 [Nitrospinaceae bacterium]
MEWTNEKPWQGLGVEIASHLSAREMSVKLQLDWEVVKTPSQRPKSPANQETFRFFKAYVEAADLRIESIGSLDDGRIIWALVPLNEDFSLVDIDPVKGYLLMASRHENRQSVEILFLTVREVGHNMLQVPVKVRSTLKNIFRKQFTNTFPFLNQIPQKFDDAMNKKARDAIEAGRKAISAFASDAGRLANHKVDDQTALRYFFDVFQPDVSSATPVIGEKEIEEKADDKTRNAVEALKNAPGQELETAHQTAWGLLNAVTYTVDHHLGKNPDSRLRQAWFGTNAKTKKRAFELALELL